MFQTGWVQTTLIQRLYTLLCTTISASMPELLPNTSCWSVNEAINFGRAPHNTAVESRDKSEWALIYLFPSGYVWSHASYTSYSHYYIYLGAQMLHNQMEFNNSLHIGTHSLERCRKKPAKWNVPQEKRNHSILNASTRRRYLSPECNAFGEL